jgi:hypothetical protein
LQAEHCSLLRSGQFVELRGSHFAHLHRHSLRPRDIVPYGAGGCNKTTR